MICLLISRSIFSIDEITARLDTLNNARVICCEVTEADENEWSYNRSRCDSTLFFNPCYDITGYENVMRTKFHSDESRKLGDMKFYSESG